MGDGESRCPRCGAALPSAARFCSSCGFAATRLASGEILDGKYEILGKLAEGGMGEVYRARHVHLDEIRVIKVTKPDAVTAEGGEGRRFAEEARLATLVRHPNVAALYDFSRLPDGSFYMASEYIDGVTVEEWLRRRGPMPPDLALSVARQVLSGLAEIHAQGIVHRDLSPDNILLRETPGGRLQAKIIDLGIAKRVSAESLRMTGTGLFVGKLKYCSPEQAGGLRKGEALDARSDLYSFGVVLYEMLAGQPPFEGATPEEYLGRHLHEAAPRLNVATLPAAAGRRLADTLARALEKDRSRRFADADEFRRAVEEIEPAVADSPALGPAATARARPARRPLPFAGIAALVVLLAAAGIYAVVHWPRPGGPGDSPAVLPAPPPSAPSPVATVEPPETAGLPAAAETAPGRGDGARRAVSDPSEAGVVRRPTAPASPPASASPAAEEEDADAVVEAPPMDARAGRRLRLLWDGWSGAPVERQAREARSLARFADRFVGTYPDDPLSGELRLRLPDAFRSLARKELDANRPRLAARFYAAYRDLAFSPSDPELDRLFAGVPPPRSRRF